ncbi:nitrogen fixation protein FixH [Leptospira selangorensis]|uniref:Nitrogen fixation protein FixH n=1 Tax=Leptospira selangorensis TaxID=2484982 RepID=A0A5F2C1X7_9LEPT|nr:FixH family protein [Leptospira selangorensis]TGM11510.1 nitrogen fixation protein FixH [Leptospira selangorensis]TGM21159.1 nitrogen fixation protein FixH [Leptospira selangorensis]
MDVSLKRAFWVIKIAFLALFVATFYTVKLALSGYTPAIDSNYYEKGLKYEQSILSQRKMIEAGYGFQADWIQKPSILQSGKQELQLEFKHGQEKIKGAQIQVQLDKTATEKFNETITLKEITPGKYKGTLSIPFPGEWRVSISAKIPEGTLEKTVSAKVIH